MLWAKAGWRCQENNICITGQYRLVAFQTIVKTMLAVNTFRVHALDRSIGLLQIALEGIRHRDQFDTTTVGVQSLNDCPRSSAAAADDTHFDCVAAHRMG